MREPAISIAGFFALGRAQATSRGKNYVSITKNRSIGYIRQRGELIRIGMSIRNALASLAVKDLKKSEPWYNGIFGRAADAKPMPTLADWKFPNGGWLQVYELPERAGNCSCTLAVENLAEEKSNLDRMGVNVGEIPSNGQLKVFMIKDPDGNSIAFAEALDSSLKR